MKTIVSNFARVLSLAALLAGVAGTALGQTADRYTLHLNNDSGYDIYHIHLTSSDDGSWGPDLLGSSDILTSPGSVDIINIVAGEHDLKLVDEDGDDCVRMRVQFFQDKAINITRDWLIGCEFHNPGR